MHIVFCGSGWFTVVDAIRERLGPDHEVELRDPGAPLEQVLRRAQVVLPSNARLDAAAIAGAPALRLIQQPAVGVDGIDLSAARARGIPVCNAPGVNGESVAQAALLLLLALARRLGAARRTFAEARIGEPVGIELGGRVLGLVGAGRSATALARAAAALGMEVISVRSTSRREELEDLLARADFVSIHCPLNAETRGLFGDAAFARMKRGSFLVNCARGPIVERAALERALASGRLAGFGLDTHWEEPWDPGDPLYAREDVLALPHIAGSTAEAYGRIADIVAENVRRLERGEPLRHRVA